MLSRILKQAKLPLKDAAAVNSTRSRLLEQLKSTKLPVETGTGGRTKYNRTRLERTKTHWLDAACVGVVDKLRVQVTQPLLITAKGWGSRQMCIPNQYGFPKSHRTRNKAFFGFQTGDMVRAILPSGKFAGTHVGRLTVRESGVFEMRTHIGIAFPDLMRYILRTEKLDLQSPGVPQLHGNRYKVSPVRHKYCKTVHHSDGYMYAFSANVQ